MGTLNSQFTEWNAKIPQHSDVTATRVAFSVLITIQLNFKYWRELEFSQFWGEMLYWFFCSPSLSSSIKLLNTNCVTQGGAYSLHCISQICCVPAKYYHVWVFFYYPRRLFVKTRHEIQMNMKYKKGTIGRVGTLWRRLPKPNNFISSIGQFIYFPVKPTRIKWRTKRTQISGYDNWSIFHLKWLDRAQTLPVEKNKS